MRFQRETSVFKFPRRTVDGKHLKTACLNSSRVVWTAFRPSVCFLWVRMFFMLFQRDTRIRRELS